jgi:hypothetical protein
VLTICSPRALFVRGVLRHLVEDGARLTVDIVQDVAFDVGGTDLAVSSFALASVAAEDNDMSSACGQGSRNSLSQTRGSSEDHSG